MDTADESPGPPLHLASLDELVEELNSRTSAIALAYRWVEEGDAELGQSSGSVLDGDPVVCAGMVEVLRLRASDWLRVELLDAADEYIDTDDEDA